VRSAAGPIFKGAQGLFELFSSLKLAVVIMSALTVAMIAATLLESKYDTATAQYFVYRAAWFRLILGMLGVLILTVALSRLPWKRRHVPFLLAHAGILILLFGSWLTDRFGLDGSMRVAEGEASSTVETQAANLVISDGDTVRTVPVPWVPPIARFRPIAVERYGLRVAEMLSHADPIYSYAAPRELEASRPAFPAARVTIQGGPMRITQDYWLWLGDPAWHAVQAGPARLVLDGPGQRGKDSARDLDRQLTELTKFRRPWLRLTALEGGGLGWVSSSSAGVRRSGRLTAAKASGHVIDPGWKGGLTITVTEWIPKAVQQTTYERAQVQWGERAPPSAIRVVAGSGGDGQELWLGQGDRAVLQIAGREVGIGYLPNRVVLPFSLRLERFRIDHYDGTRDPASYASQVTVIDGPGKEAPADISMNEPLVHGGITFYQASYEDAEPRPTVSIFSVNRDPGRPYKYWGSILIVLGSILLFLSRWRSSMKKRSPVTAAAPVALLLCLCAAPALAKGGVPGEPKSGWDFETAGLTPVLSGGRLKPLDTFARELVLFTTGSRSYKGWNSLDLTLSWLSAPREWEGRPIIQVGREDVRRQLGLDPKRTRFSPRELIQESHLAQYAESLMRRPPPAQGQKQEPRDQELKRVLDRVGLFRNIVSGEAWPLVPSPPPGAWKPLTGDEPHGAAVRHEFAELARAHADGDQARFEAASLRFRSSVEEAMGPALTAGDRRGLAVESVYNHTRPFLVAWILYLLGAILYAVSHATKSARVQSVSAWTILAAAVIQIAGISMRSYVAGRPPVTNMYESIVWVAIGVVFFGGILYWVKRQGILLGTSAALATLCLIAADAAPAVMDPGIHPLVPVLRSNYWLTIHVLTITLGYAAFALALGLGNVTLFQYLRGGPGAQARILNLNQLTYRAHQFGVVLLAAGTILGGVWADYSWGRFWGWDPKEVWALIALMGYLIILHARFTGLVGQFGFAAWSVVAFVLVLTAWYGVNFVLGVGLHSYGWSTGGRGWVAGFTAAQLAYVGLVALRHRARRAGLQAAARTS
jgi:cytochrome c-type biogenesis protein CcsB